MRFISSEGKEIDTSKYKLEYSIRPMKVRDLKTGDKVTIGGMEMIFSHFNNKTPVFYQDVNGLHVHYSKSEITKDTLISEIK